MATATKDKPAAADKKTRVPGADYKLLVSAGRDDQGRETFVELGVAEKAKNPLNAIEIGIDSGIGIEDGDVIGVVSVTNFKVINVELERKTRVKHRGDAEDAENDES